MYKTFSKTIFFSLIFLGPQKLCASRATLDIIIEDAEEGKSISTAEPSKSHPSSKSRLTSASQQSSESSEIIASFPFKPIATEGITAFPFNPPVDDSKDQSMEELRKSDPHLEKTYSLEELINSVTEEVRTDMSKKSSMNRYWPNTAASRENSASSISGVMQKGKDNSQGTDPMVTTSSDKRVPLAVPKQSSPSFYKKRIFPTAPLTGELDNMQKNRISSEPSVPKSKPRIFPYGVPKNQEDYDLDATSSPENLIEDNDSAIKQNSSDHKIKRKKSRFKSLKNKIAARRSKHKSDK